MEEEIENDELDEGDVLDISDEEIEEDTQTETSELETKDEEIEEEVPISKGTSSSSKVELEEPIITKELRGLITSYPNIISFENKEDTFSLLKDIVLIYKLMSFCEIKSKKEGVKKEIKKIKKEFEKRGFLEMIEFYNNFISKDMHFGTSRVRRKLDVFVNGNMTFLLDTIQFWMYVLPFKSKKDMHMDTAHGLPAATAEDFERNEIEKGEKVSNLDGPFRLDDEGEVIPVV